jgi:sialate O-acetylesterase
MRHIRTLIALLLLGFLLPGLQGASLKLPSILGDHMVLQQNSFARIWGWSEASAEVKVSTSWNGKTYSTRADAKGNWQVKVATAKAGGPYSLTIEGDITLELKDILLGEVWICSGQSNMEWPLSRTETGETEIPVADYPEIRLFTVKRHISPRPLEDVTGSWSACTPETAESFSAVGYFFGKKLHKDLGVPVGLVNTSWGGTPSESWTSREMLQTFGDFDAQLDKLYNSTGDEMKKAEEEAAKMEAAIESQWDFDNKENIGYKEGWMRTSYDDGDWKSMPVPAEWSSVEEVGMLEGVMWLRTLVLIPSSWKGKNLVLDLGPVDETDVTWINGVEVGSSKVVANWNKNRSYQIPGSAVETDELLLAVRVVNGTAQGGIFGHPEQLKIYPEGDRSADPVLLAGDWKYKIAYKFPRIARPNNSHTPSVLYNGMLFPLKNLAIRGAIWYQGESNQERAMQYRTIFPGMIQDWRNTWRQGDFPFYFVQLAPFKYANEHTSAELREAQFLTLSRLKNTGMAVTLDIGNPDDIHPANKRDVGKRLALWALAKDYGKDLVYSGPLYREQKVEGTSIRLYFDHVGSGLVARDGDLTHFEIAGEDQVYHPAKASIDGKTVLVSSPRVSAPLAVRFAWSNTAEPNLFNQEGLPASSFCTDQWKRITDK